jgi:type I restriction enzyme S subunit
MSHENFLERIVGGVDVAWKPLGEIGTFIRGSGIQKSDFTDSGAGCIHYGQIHTHYGTWATTTKSFISHDFSARLKKAKTGDLVIATTSEDDEAVAKAVAWLGDEDVAVSTDAYIYRHTANPKYMSYFFQTEIFQSQKKPYITGTKVRRISGDSLAKILIPIPCPDNPKKSLEIQAEIVLILDSFTELTAELTAAESSMAIIAISCCGFRMGKWSGGRWGM